MTTRNPVIHRAAALRDLVTPLTAIVAQASAAVRAIDRTAARPTEKADGSPLTAADLAADRIIAGGLAQLPLAWPVISEERVTDVAATDHADFFIVDPIDGTKEFLGGFDDYTVNLALVRGGRPLLGLVAAPALGLLWRGLVGQGAERLSLSAQGEAVGTPVPIHTRPCPAEWIAAVSRSHCDARTDAFIKSRAGGRRQAIGSALKFCRIAEGAADIYPRLSPTSEWDIAAGHAVLEAAGGRITDTTGRPLQFRGNPTHIVIPEFIAFGDPTLAL